MKGVDGMKYKGFWISKLSDGDWYVFLENNDDGGFKTSRAAKQALDKFLEATGETGKVETTEPEQPEPENRRVDIGEDEG